jgi:hypothetical protein
LLSVLSEASDEKAKAGPPSFELPFDKLRVAQGEG